MALALNNLKRVDMPLNKGTKPNQKNPIYLIYMYKEDLALNNRQWFICRKTQPNKIIYICYICIKSIWNWITYNGWYAIKSNETKSYIFNIYIYIKRIWLKTTYNGWYAIKTQTNQTNQPDMLRFTYFHEYIFPLIKTYCISKLCFFFLLWISGYVSYLRHYMTIRIISWHNWIFICLTHTHTHTYIYLYKHYFNNIRKWSSCPLSNISCIRN